MMTTERLLQMLFVGYVRSFASFRWYSRVNHADITAKELHHFSEIGERIGFVVRREMNWEHPRDLCWVETVDPGAVPFLYLERESKQGRMRHTIEKMLDPQNGAGVPVLVASFGLLNASSFEIASRMLRDGVRDGQSALLYAWIGDREDAPRFDVRADVITEARCLTTEATPYLNAESAAPYWCMRFEGGQPTWRQREASKRP